MNTLVALWKFSRPHTIIGSVISICTLYFIICYERETVYLPYLIIALLIGVSCNIFIVGINQVADIKIDRINKPYLPIPSGVLTMRQAKIIVLVSLAICLVSALLVSLYLFGILALATLIGWAYSMPPFHLKQHHLSAALAISLVRGILLNAGGFMVFNYLVNGSLVMPEPVKILTLFIIVFSIAISWFKDLPDVEGDARFHIKTVAVLYSSRNVLIAGHILVSLAYLVTIYLNYLDFSQAETPSARTTILLFGHVSVFLLFIVNAFSVKLNKQQSIKKFYTRFWWFFFAEYLVYLLAYSV